MPAVSADEVAVIVQEDPMAVDEARTRVVVGGSGFGTHSVTPWLKAQKKVGSMDEQLLVRTSEIDPMRAESPS